MCVIDPERVLLVTYAELKKLANSHKLALVILVCHKACPSSGDVFGMDSDCTVEVRNKFIRFDIL
jgi:hypothetical protein